MNKKSQQGIALIWIVIAGAILIIGVGGAASKRTALKVKKFQPEVTSAPTVIPTIVPSPTPTTTSSPSPKPQGLPPGFLDWTTNKNWLPQPPGNIGKDIQEMQQQIERDMELMRKNLSEIPSLGKQPEYPGSGYTPPSVDVFNLDMEKFEKGVIESINKINEQSREEMKKRIEGH
jgi:hypothetical protein